MPVLNWLGKDKVVNHHNDVPFRVLDRKYSYGESSENMLIKGDNLHALKALLPQYEGRVKCIYIDPPYNSGNEGWVYNDNVNDPKIRKWLGEVVGKEGEDLSRHDKWLCMMYPRLRLLQRLLADDGAIFISIDDNEQANLKLICDEIFGSRNFVANVIWQKRTSPDARLNLGAAHDFIIVYAKDIEELKPTLNKLQLSDDRSSQYKNPDNDVRGVWASVDMTGQTGHATPSQYYEITTPSGKKYPPPKGRCWALSESTFNDLFADNRIWFGDKGESRPRKKIFLSETEGANVWTWWTHSEVGHNQEAKKEIIKILQSDIPFETPKPTRLIERILNITTNPGDIILDSFAGSGTTAHAVLNLNKTDGGNRRFILVEMEDYAETITAERVRRVIDGYGDIAGTGGGFAYYELGEPLLFKDGNLNEAIPAEKIYEYVWYTETRTAYTPQAEKYYLGAKSDTAYYFHYERNAVTSLDEDFLRTLTVKAARYVIYADMCALGAADLARFNITFRKIPRDIKNLTEA
jgi:adenine-specific DNA-methyltransferase